MDNRWSPQITEMLWQAACPVQFRVCGNSMQPTLQPGDTVWVEKAAAESLRRGEIVLFQDGEQLLLHRYLGRTGTGLVRTKGDGMRYFDRSWQPDALLGRVTRVERAGVAYPRLAASAWLGLLYLWLGSLASAARLCQAQIRGKRGATLGLMVLLLAGASLFAALVVRAAVTLVSFTASGEVNRVVVRWETASEVDNIGFNLLRAQDSASGTYTQLNDDIIPGSGDTVGGQYDYVDTQVLTRTFYFYRLESVALDGSTDVYGPVSAWVLAPGDPTLTPTPSPSPSPTPTASATPTASPTTSDVATSTYTPTPTRTPTRTPTATPSRTPTRTPSPTVPSGSTNTPAPTSTWAPTHTATPPRATLTPSRTPTPSSQTATPSRAAATPVSPATVPPGQSTAAPSATAPGLSPLQPTELPRVTSQAVDQATTPPAEPAGVPTSQTAASGLSTAVPAPGLPDLSELPAAAQRRLLPAYNCLLPMLCLVLVGAVLAVGGTVWTIRQSDRSERS